MYRFDSLADAQQKLDGSVILYRKEPHCVVAIEGTFPELWLHLNQLPSTRPFALTDDTLSVSISHKSLDWMSIASLLGYCTHFKGVNIKALRPVRIPRRISTQGLHSRNVQVYDTLNLQPSTTTGFKEIVIQKNKKNNGLVQPICSVYPTLQDCMTVLEDGKKKTEEAVSSALTRDCAVEYPIVGPPILIYKGTKVGWTPDGVVFMIPPRYHYLEETLTWQGIPIRREL